MCVATRGARENLIAMFTLETPARLRFAPLDPWLGFLLHEGWGAEASCLMFVRIHSATLLMDGNHS